MSLLTLGVVALGPVVAGAALAKDKVVRPEYLAEGASPDRVHGSGLQVKQDGPGHVLATRSLVVVDFNAFQLEFGGAVIVPIGIDAMLIRDDLPELEIEDKKDLFIV